MICARSKRDLVSVGVDYLTASASETKGRKALERIGEWELRKEQSRGNELSTFRLRDFEGLRCGSAEVARSENYSLVRVSSHIAYERWRDIVPMAGNVSRLDVQVTMRLTPHIDNLAERVEALMLRFKKAHNRKYQLQLVRNDVKGKTLYSGSRKSDVMARLYDKGKESKLAELAGCWRGELQLSDRPALMKAKQLLDSEAVEDVIVNDVAGYYAARGAVVLDSCRVRRVGILRPVFAQNSSDRLSWLKTQVRPYIEREISRGNLSEVLDALGLAGLLSQDKFRTKLEE